MSEFPYQHEPPERTRLGSAVSNMLGYLGLTGERTLALNNRDWPSEIPGPDVTKEEFYDVLKRIPAVYDAAMEDLRNTPLD